MKNVIKESLISKKPSVMYNNEEITYIGILNVLEKFEKRICESNDYEEVRKWFVLYMQTLEILKEGENNAKIS